MPLCLTPRIDRIAQAVTGRATPFFAADVAAQHATIAVRIAGKRVLVAGGAGSIGSATIHELIAFAPSALAVIDPSENNLAELIRSLRSRPEGFRGELDIQPLDYGSPLFAGWLAQQAPFDVVLSFAALKHVRSERDAFSLCRMLEVNLAKGDRFLAAVRRHGHGRDGIFLVSTDKAANPVSLMGASKRAMELLLWAHSQPGCPASLLDGGTADPAPRITTTRFANVAFSDGSLPWAFLQRLEKDQPLAAPGDIRRYLVSPRESGQLCLLAAFIAPHRHVLVPRLDPDRDLVTFTAIAEHTLRAFGLSPAWYDDEATARAAVATERAQGRWPVLVTRSDTSGEKDIEEFIAHDETATDIGLQSAQAIPGTRVDLDRLAGLLRLIDRACTAGTPPAKADLAQALAAVVPDLKHQETGRSLDSKM
jgi:FlaA1/EpsC-like NDP-sugar epimerase